MVVAEIVVQRKLPPAAVGARVRVDIAYVAYMAQAVAHHALAGGGAEMAAEPPVHELDVFRHPPPDREAADHDDTVAFVERTLDGGDVFGDRIEREVAPCHVVEIEPAGHHAFDCPLEGGEVPGTEVEGKRLFSANRGAGPGGRVIDAVFNHGELGRGEPASSRVRFPNRREWRPDVSDRVWHEMIRTPAPPLRCRPPGRVSRA